MKHILLTDPFLWGKAESIIIEDICVSWLMIVPILDEEFHYADERGVDALEKLLAVKDIDIYNIFRKTVV